MFSPILSDQPGPDESAGQFGEQAEEGGQQVLCHRDGTAERVLPHLESEPAQTQAVAERSVRPCYTSRSGWGLRSPPTVTCWKKGRASILVMTWTTATPCNPSERPPLTQWWTAEWSLRH